MNGAHLKVEPTRFHVADSAGITLGHLQLSGGCWLFEPNAELALTGRDMQAITARVHQLNTAQRRGAPCG